jgi:hypothetical protein
MSDYRVPERSDDLDDEAILADIRRVADDLDRTPTLADLVREGRFSQAAYSDRFGGYSEAVVRAGIVDDHPTTGRIPIPTEDVLADIARVRDELGRWPRSNEYNGIGEYSWQVLYHRLDMPYAEILSLAKEAYDE